MPPRRLRLDAELVRRGMARSREQASALIDQGRVTVNGLVALKPATSVTTDADLVVRPDEQDPGFASRGGHKLAGALDDFTPLGLGIQGRRCLDAGASTGGFTDVLLRAGAAQVVAVDVGYGQLVWRLQQDPRVVVHDRTNVRDLTVEMIGGTVDLVVGDLSFISLEMVLPALATVTKESGDLVLMIKPQFEVGRERLGKGGVVRDPDLRAEAVTAVLDRAASLGWRPQAVTTSQLPGPSGNVEFFAWLRTDSAGMAPEEIRRVVVDRRRLSVPDESVVP